MAKSADAADLKSAIRKDVWVQIPPRAPCDSYVLKQHTAPGAEWNSRLALRYSRLYVVRIGLWSDGGTRSR